MNRVEFPQTLCYAGVARADITPPVGIYHRMWGAAKHERATGVHRPLTATLLWLAPNDDDHEAALVIASLDHCLLDETDIELMQRSVAAAVQLQPGQVQISMTHTHGAGLMLRSRAEMPGGELIGPYLDEVAATLAKLAAQVRDKLQMATIVYGTGRCNLAADRDYWDEERAQFVCGFNPLGLADDTLLVARINSFMLDECLGIIVNYACHPTTLAWENTAISPDYLGAMRETIESAVNAPCLFLQGASADLGPREGFVGDWDVADSNGRRLGFASLSALESLPMGAACYEYQGPVVSGAVIGTWELVACKHRFKSLGRFDVRHATVELPYRIDLPELEETQRQLTEFQSQETASANAGDEAAARDWHAKAEQMTRQLWKLQALPAGKFFPLSFSVARLGDAIWLFLPGEHYQMLQTTLRRRFPDHPWIVTTISNGWQPGYLPPASKYGYGIYQEQVAVVGPGAAELVVEAIAREAQRLTAEAP